jgi:hypothetical protein
LVTLYIVFGVLVVIAIGLSVYAYRIYQEDKKLGFKKIRKQGEEPPLH